MLRLIVWVAAIWFVLVFFTGCGQIFPNLGSAKSESPAAKWAKAKPVVDPDQVPKAGPPKMKAATFYTAGLLLENQEKYPAAIEQYKQTLVEDPSHANAANHIGICQVKLQQYDQAEKSFRQAIQILPNQPHFHNNLGFAYLLQNKLPDAEAELRNALALDSEFPRAYTNLGLTIAKEGKIDLALACFKKAGPEYLAHYNMALFLHAQKKWDLAKQHYDLSVKSNPDFKPSIEGLEQLKKDRNLPSVKVAKVN